MSLRLAALAAVSSLVLSGAAPAAAAPASAATGRPARVDLPTGFQPEGIDVGPGQVAYVGSLADGSLYRADLRTGEGEVFSPAVGSPSVGLEVDDRGRIFVAGGPTGTARVIDATTGELLADYALSGAGDGTTAASAVNDVVVTDRAAYFTDSVAPVLYRLPLGRFGQLPAPDEVEVIPYSGDLVYDEDPATFDANGIETTPDGAALLVVQTRTGLLFRVDPETGRSVQVRLRGEVLTSGDGLTRDGRTLYAVQPLSNQVAVLRLARDGRSGRVRERLTDEVLDVPTTVAVAGDRLHLPNARFGIGSPQSATYEVVTLDRP